MIQTNDQNQKLIIDNPRQNTIIANAITPQSRQ